MKNRIQALISKLTEGVIINDEGTLNHKELKAWTLFGMPAMNETFILGSSIMIPLMGVLAVEGNP
jgi:hypothetical protein